MRLAAALALAMFGSGLGCTAHTTPRSPRHWIEVLAGGDIQLGGAEDPLSELGYALGASVRFANLEGPITDRGLQEGLDSDGRPTGRSIHFRSPVRTARWLQNRFDVLSLANNHALDQGEAGRADTAQALQ